MSIKKRLTAIENKLNETNFVKMLFSEVPVGSIFVDESTFYSGREFIVNKKLKDFEQPSYKISYLTYPYGPLDKKYRHISFCSFIDYYDLTKYGKEECLNMGYIKIIDMEYVNKVKKLRNCKTIKEIKEFIETIL